MDYTILLIQGAGEVTFAQEQVIVEALKSKLADGFTIVYPPMPDADTLTYLAWESVLSTNLEHLSGKVILLGHSLGASIILKHFSRRPLPKKVIGLALFGVPYWKDQHWDVSEYTNEDEFLGTLSKLDPIYFHHSLADEVILDDQFKAYQKLIPKAHLRVFSGMDHSYCAAIREMIKDIQEPASA